MNNNKKEKPEIIKENNISQEINEDIKKEETNKENNINNVNKNNNSPKNKIIEKQIKNEEKKRHGFYQILLQELRNKSRH